MKRLYLDTRDLIELLTHSQPIGLDDLAAILKARRWSLVYSFSNTCEVAIPNDLYETRRRFGILAELQHSFIRSLPPLREMEFTNAVAEYSQTTAPRMIDAYVTAWHQTFTYPSQDASLALAASVSLPDQVVEMAARNPALFRNQPAQMQSLQSAVDKDRSVTDAVRRNRARFEGAVNVALREAGLATPAQGLTKFARWLREDPRRCPGWRIFDESYLEFCSNTQDRVDLGDLSDWMHLSALPYVDGITLDRRIAGYAKASSDKLRKLNPNVTYAQRVFSNLQAWLDSLEM